MRVERAPITEGQLCSAQKLRWSRRVWVNTRVGGHVTFKACLIVRAGPRRSIQCAQTTQGERDVLLRA